MGGALQIPFREGHMMQCPCNSPPPSAGHAPSPVLDNPLFNWMIRSDFLPTVTGQCRYCWCTSAASLPTWHTPLHHDLTAHIADTFAPRPHCPHCRHLCTTTSPPTLQTPLHHDLTAHIADTFAPRPHRPHCRHLCTTTSPPTLQTPLHHDLTAHIADTFAPRPHCSRTYSHMQYRTVNGIYSSNSKLN